MMDGIAIQSRLHILRGQNPRGSEVEQKARFTGAISHSLTQFYTHAQSTANMGRFRC